MQITKAGQIHWYEARDRAVNGYYEIYAEF